MSLWQFKRILICAGAALFMLTALAHLTLASECEDISKLMPKGQGCSDSSGWDPTAKLDQIGTGQGDQAQSPPATKWPQKSRQYRWNVTDGLNNSSSVSNVDVNAPSIKPTSSSSFNSKMAPVSNMSKFDVLLDVSPDEKEFIPGAVYIDYRKFQDNGTLRPASELARILGDAGISSNNSVLIYGECQCAMGPAASSYVYLIMRYLGHDPDKIRVLDGGIRDWVDANHSAVNQSKILPRTSYAFEQKSEFLATYEYVKSGNAQLVDARIPQDFGTESMLGSINIPFDQIMSNRMIKDEADLKKMFSVLQKDRPVVVYSGEGEQASLVWFALEILGYDAKLYTWHDWLLHKKSKGNIS